MNTQALPFARAIGRRLAAAFERQRRAFRARHELSVLDGAALRDLGLSASEFDSYLAEASGDARRTRRRLAPQR
jgi:uncharacterized protein YjiS (DUF1127 family)